MIVEYSSGDFEEVENIFWKNSTYSEKIAKIAKDQFRFRYLDYYLKSSNSL